jgi:hypothetical protein
MPKIEPAVTQLLYAVPDGTSYIDLAKDLSKVNRRLYRQGYTYVVQDIQCVVPSALRASDVHTFTFSTMGNSWMVHNAHKKAFKTWQRMQNEYMDGAGSRLKGKWADFKIYLDDSMAAATILEPYAGDNAAYADGEWIYSNFVYDDVGTTRSPTMHMIGSVVDDTAIGLIEAYANSRNYQGSSPDQVSEIASGFYAQFHGVGDIDNELGIDIRDDNDLPPYELDDYPGGATNADAAVPVRLAAVSGTQASMTSPGFIVPCGLIKIFTSELALTDAHAVTLADDSTSDGPGPNSVYSQGTASTSYVLITMAPGAYRGVLAAPMGQ